MASKFYRDFKHTAKEDIRIFLVPYRGAYQGILKELASPKPKSIPHALAKTLRIAISPVVGAISAVTAELKKPTASKK